MHTLKPPCCLLSTLPTKIWYWYPTCTNHFLYILYQAYLAPAGTVGPRTRNRGPKPGAPKQEQIERFILGANKVPYARRWSEVQTVYNVHNIGNTHWIAVALHLDRQAITVYDSMPSLYEKSLHDELRPYSEELPKILSAMGFYDSYNHAEVDTEKAKKCKLWPITRCPEVPVQPDGYVHIVSIS